MLLGSTIEIGFVPVRGRGVLLLSCPPVPSDSSEDEVTDCIGWLLELIFLAGEDLLFGDSCPLIEEWPPSGFIGSILDWSWLVWYLLQGNHDEYTFLELDTSLSLMDEELFTELSKLAAPSSFFTVCSISLKQIFSHLVIYTILINLKIVLYKKIKNLFTSDTHVEVVVAWKMWWTAIGVAQHSREQASHRFSQQLILEEWWAKLRGFQSIRHTTIVIAQIN